MSGFNKNFTLNDLQRPNYISADRIHATAPSRAVVVSRGAARK
jgi:hypothetical protein